MELLEAADVVRGDGNWTAGGAYDAPCSLRSFISPICEPERIVLGNENPDLVATVTNKALTTNVATLTIGANEFEVGDSVTVAGVGAPFDGTYTLTARTDTTISYAKVNANVASAAATGTVTGEPHDDADAECGVESFPFAVVTSLASRARFGGPNYKSWVRDALDAETEKAVGAYLFAGSTAFDPGERYAYLESTEVRTVPAGADAEASVVALLKEFWANSVGIENKDAMLHVGFEAYLELDTLIKDGKIRGTDITVVMSPGYPTDEIAITGPVTIRLSTDEVLEEYTTAVNDRIDEATRLVSLEFNPCHAVRVA